MAGKYRAYPAYKDSGVEWLGEIPTGWNAIRLKHVADLEGQKIDPARGLNYVGMENVQSGNGRYIETEEVSPEGISSGFSEGNVLFGKLRPYLAKSWLATFSGICSSEFLVLNSRLVSRKFLLYFTLCDEFVQQVDSSTYGSKMPRASWEFIGLMVVPTPPENESEHIAKFLDHETAKIDTLIEKQQQLIKLLKEKRQAVISHAVTKGLNPNVPTKDSGVEWLGEVPAHWGKKAIKHLLCCVVDNRGRTPPIEENGIPIVEVSQVAGAGRYTSVDYSKYISEDSFHEYIRANVLENDVLFVTVGATVGKTCLVPKDPDFVIAQNLVAFRSAMDVCPEFLMYLLNSQIGREAIAATNKSNTIDNVKVSDFIQFKVCLPSMAEQTAISTHILELDRQIEKTCELAERQQILLQERRTALISAAVTGKIDVRDWQPPSSTESNANV